MKAGRSAASRLARCRLAILPGLQVDSLIILRGDTMMKLSLFTGLMLALALAAGAAAQSDQTGAAGAQQQTAPAQTAPAQSAPAQSAPAQSAPSSAGSPQQGTGADASHEPATAPTSPSSRTPAGAPSSPATAGGSILSSDLAATEKTFIRDAA